MVGATAAVPSLLSAAPRWNSELALKIGKDAVERLWSSMDDLGSFNIWSVEGTVGRLLEQGRRMEDFVARVCGGGVSNLAAIGSGLATRVKVGWSLHTHFP